MSLVSKLTVDAGKALDKSGIRLVVAMAADFATVADYSAFAVKGGPRSKYCAELVQRTGLAERTVANASTQAGALFGQFADTFHALKSGDGTAAPFYNADALRQLSDKLSGIMKGASYAFTQQDFARYLSGKCSVAEQKRADDAARAAAEAETFARKQREAEEARNLKAVRDADAAKPQSEAAAAAAAVDAEKARIAALPPAEEKPAPTAERLPSVSVTFAVDGPAILCHAMTADMLQEAASLLLDMALKLATDAQQAQAQAA